MKSRLKVLFVILIVPLMLLFCGIVSSAYQADTDKAEESWCTVTFYNRGEVWYEERVVCGMPLTSQPMVPEREGYKFSHWSSSVGVYEEGSRIYESVRYDAVYELLPPTFNISTLEFEYDGRARELGFSQISHPYLSSGLLSYEWFKDGAPLGVYSSSVAVKNVSDSGYYTARLMFSVMGDVASVTTSPILVNISKKEITPPKIPDAVYTGNEIYPDIFDTGAYSVEKRSYILTGVYPVKLTLCDSENYAFFGTESSSVYVDFTIKSAENYFLEPLRINDIYTSMAPVPYALARFGEVEYLYSTSAVGVFSPNPPRDSGVYYVKAVVANTDCYSGLESDAVRFTVIEETVSGIAINTYPDKLKYVAFERLVTDGLSISVSYNSGRRSVVYDGIEVGYLSADSLRFGDSGVILSYRGASVILLVDVGKATYDISGVAFSDAATVYNGRVQSLAASVRLPVGEDNIPLTASIEGGGVDVGSYRVSLVFKTESKNYEIPPSIYATLTVEPMPVSVCWEGERFVYDGSPKLPGAFYIDVNGKRVTLSTAGERTNAGEYTATAISPDPNYRLINPTSAFTVQKANYDISGVIWQGGDEEYDGNPKRVILTNLPSGVFVVGYVNATATECGSYVATATLSYDEKNYLPPCVPSFTWRIIPAQYDLSTFEFLDNEAVYSGEKNYPLLVGDMPIGADGIALEYEFSAYAINTLDGEVEVEIRFFTNSKNYTSPGSIIRYVKVLPMGVRVEWHSLNFVYTGAVNVPYAVSEYTTLSVIGGKIDAGEYLATATADDQNYYVINDTVEYTVSPAQNYWIITPSVSDIFFGDIPSPSAKAEGDGVVFRYYLDAECKSELSYIPDEVGTYYMVAESSGGRNYLPISSSPIKFEIIAVVPIGISVVMRHTDFVALDVISSDDLSAYLEYNNGVREPIDFAGIGISYPNGERLVYGDSSVIFTYGEFKTEQHLDVIKRAFDLSGVIWCDTVAIYDGKPKYAHLSGLPDGLTVIGYSGNGRINAGQYTVRAELQYDGHNYLTPDIESATLTIKKQTVPIPIIQSSEYDGMKKTPTLPTDSRYTHAFSFTADQVGRYGVCFLLVDCANYCFENGLDTVTVDFVVTPRKVKISLSDVDVYLFERYSDISTDWSITAGSVVAGDDLLLRFFVDGDRLLAVSDNSNYAVTVTPAYIDRHIFPSPYVISSSMLVFAILNIIALVIILILLNRKRIRATAVAYSENSANAGVLFAPVPDEPVDEAPEHIDESPSMSVSVDYAESVITNSLAKDLIRHDDNVITSGNRRGIINVDTLSRSFSAGERVDINALKSKSLIPYDTGYIKVLARGIIDKPLYVYANDFSLAAVKMIALTGGKAIKVSTSRENRKNNSG